MDWRQPTQAELTVWLARIKEERLAGATATDAARVFADMVHARALSNINESTEEAALTSEHGMS